MRTPKRPPRIARRAAVGEDSALFFDRPSAGHVTPGGNVDMSSADSDRHRGPRLAWILLAWGLVFSALFSLGGCGGGSDQRDTADGSVDYGSSDLFPVPPEIQPNVDFWRHVYGVWSRGQVAFHDDLHMGVIYEVARLPGPLSEGYTASQKQFVDSRKAYYQNRVADLEQKVRANQSLSSEDRQLLAKFEKAGNASAVYGASERVRTQRGLRERFRRGVEISGRYDQAFREVMRANGVPEDLAYLPHVESSFQTNARSSVGAAGVWQFMPSTGKTYMDVNGAVDERLDPILCADGAARYLAQAHGRLRSWPLAITSYNHGVGGMAKAKAQHGNDIGRIVRDYNGPAFKFASRNFYSEFVAAREVASHADRYFPEGLRREPPWPHDRVVLQAPMPVHHVAQHYGVSAGTLASLNLHFRDGARDGRTVLPAGTTLWLPAGSARRVASQPPAYGGSALVARSEPRAAVRTSRPEPALTELPSQRQARPEPVRPRSDEGRLLAVSDEDTQPRSAATARPPIVEPSRVKPELKGAKVAQVQSKPEPKGAKVAKAKPEPKAAKIAQATAKPESKGGKVAKSAPKPEAKLAKAGAKPEPKPAKAAKGGAKYHVVKPEETLYRVATLNGISVAELRRLNKMGPKENSIRPGQKLKVNI